eukprot:15053444-Ditylum_brightwellii.AAC.1
MFVALDGVTATICNLRWKGMTLSRQPMFLKLAKVWALHSHSMRRLNQSMGENHFRNPELYRGPQSHVFIQDLTLGSNQELHHLPCSLSTDFLSINHG